MGSNSNFSNNAIDRLLGHSNGAQSPPDGQKATRLEYSKQIVNINFTQLSEWCDMDTDGYIYLEEYDSWGTDALRVNIFTDIHNYLTSLYSLIEELHRTIDTCVENNVNKFTFLHGSSGGGEKYSPFIRKLPFAWGLRNQFTHGNYRCLTITVDDSTSDSYLKVEFHKTQFDPRGQEILKRLVITSGG
ncbi:hypothetical protein [Halonotius sp. GCM10025705]|uniref:hypothetical protein n=1 Tax=Halonotius sp. GCM10025705 TaxID=3252678 RepID=UPI00361CC9F1